MIACKHIRMHDHAPIAVPSSRQALFLKYVSFMTILSSCHREAPMSWFTELNVGLQATKVKTSTLCDLGAVLRAKCRDGSTRECRSLPLPRSLSFFLTLILNLFLATNNSERTWKTLWSSFQETPLNVLVMLESPRGREVAFFSRARWEALGDGNKDWVNNRWVPMADISS